MARLSKNWKAEAEDNALAAELHTILEVSHRQAKGLVDSGCVRVNGIEAHSYGLRLKAGDSIVVAFDSARTYQALPRPRKALDESGFRVLFEDNHLVFIDKPAGLLTVPAEKGQENNLAEALTDHYRRRGFKRIKLFVVHRLDRFTSGVLVFAKTPEALHGLKTIFGAHKLNRVYKAVLAGELPENAGTLTGHLVERKDLRMAVVQPKKDDPKGAKSAITHYRVLERLPGHTVVEVKLETGRRNQIRVQFADRGFPLLGDQVYGQKSEILDRQALHAEILGFRHPITDEPITVSSPLPSDMEEALKFLRTQRRVERAEAGVQGEEGIFKPKITRERKQDRVLRAQRYSEEVGEPERSRSRGPESEASRPERGFKKATGDGRSSGGPKGRPSGDNRGPSAEKRSAGAPKSRTEAGSRESTSPRSDAAPRPRKGPIKGSSKGPVQVVAKGGPAKIYTSRPKRSK